MTVKNEGDSCFEGDECQRNSRCKYSSISNTKGVCKKLFSLATGESFFARSEDDLFLCSDGYAIKNGLKGTLDPFNFNIG